MNAILCSTIIAICSAILMLIGLWPSDLPSAVKLWATGAGASYMLVSMVIAVLSQKTH